MNKPQETPGPWQIDSRGKRFRTNGKIIEYASTVMTSAGEVFEDELEAHNERMRAQTAQRIKAMQAQARREPTGDCPFKIAGGNMNVRCTRDCAFFEGDRCIFTKVVTHDMTETQGRFCPLARRCTRSCAMYHNAGCSLRAFFNTTDSESEEGKHERF